MPMAAPKNNTSYLFRWLAYLGRTLHNWRRSLVRSPTKQINKARAAISATYGCRQKSVPLVNTTLSSTSHQCSLCRTENVHCKICAFFDPWTKFLTADFHVLQFRVYHKSRGIEVIIRRLKLSGTPCRADWYTVNNISEETVAFRLRGSPQGRIQ